MGLYCAAVNLLLTSMCPLPAPALSKSSPKQKAEDVSEGKLV